MRSGRAKKRHPVKGGVAMKNLSVKIIVFVEPDVRRREAIHLKSHFPTNERSQSLSIGGDLALLPEDFRKKRDENVIFMTISILY